MNQTKLICFDKSLFSLTVSFFLEKKHLQRNANCFRQGPFQTPGWDEALGAEEQDESKNVHDLKTKYCLRLAVLEPIFFWIFF